MTESDEGSVSLCKECNCYCNQCTYSTSSIDEQWQQEINNLQQKLIDAENYIAKLDDSIKDIDLLRSDLITWKDKHKRLQEAHKRVQKLNQGLEDKLLRLVELNEVEKNTLTKDVAVVSHKLAEANYIIKKLTSDNERYKKDVSLAVQFLQCKNGSFVSHKFDSLPRELRHKITEYLFNSKKKQMEGESRRPIYEPKSIKVPIPANRTTSYKLLSCTDSGAGHMTKDDRDKPVIDVVSAAIMAKVFEEREREKANTKHCDTCKCNGRFSRAVDSMPLNTISTQTVTSSLDVTATNLVRDSIRNRTMASQFKDLDIGTICQNVAKVSPNNYLNPQSSAQRVNTVETHFNLSPIHSRNQRDDDDYYENDYHEELANSRTLADKKQIHKSRKIFPSIMYFNVNERKSRKNKNTKYGQYESLHSYCESPSDSSFMYTDDNSCDEHSNDNPAHFNSDPLNDSGISINNSYNNNPGIFVRDPSSPANVRQVTTDKLIDVITPTHNYKLLDITSPKHIINHDLQTYYSLETRTSNYYVEKIEESYGTDCSHLDKEDSPKLNFSNISSNSSNVSQAQSHEEVDNIINNTIYSNIDHKEEVNETITKQDTEVILDVQDIDRGTIAAQEENNVSKQIDAILYHYRLNAVTFDDNSVTNSDILSNSASDDYISNDRAIISTASSNATEDLQDRSFSESADDSNIIDGNMGDASLDGIDKERYAEMEMNVKRFLFGDANLYSSVAGISGDQ